MKNKTWEKVGSFSVDAGLCWIGDPCYILHKEEDDKPKDLGTSWEDFCENLEAKEKDGVASFAFIKGNPEASGLGITVSTGYGDGEYDVYVKRTYDGAIAEVKIKFIENDESNEEAEEWHI